VKHAIPRYSVISFIIRVQNRAYEASEIKRESVMNIVWRIWVDWIKGRLNGYGCMSVPTNRHKIRCKAHRPNSLRAWPSIAPRATQSHIGSQYGKGVFVTCAVIIRPTLIEYESGASVGHRASKARCILDGRIQDPRKIGKGGKEEIAQVSCTNCLLGARKATQRSGAH
jgi:hypothetical protein